MVEFRKKNPIIGDTVVSKYLPDLYNGGTATANLYGALDLSKYMFQAIIPPTPSYGSAELKRLDLNLYVNSIDVGNDPKFPQIATFLFKDTHEITEGYASLNNEVVTVLSGAVGGIDNFTLLDRFDGSGISGGDGSRVVRIGRSIAKSANLYTTVNLAHDHAQTGYKIYNMQDKHSHAEIRRDYGQTAAQLGIKDVQDFGNEPNYIQASSTLKESSWPAGVPASEEEALNIDHKNHHQLWRKLMPNPSHPGAFPLYIRDAYVGTTDVMEVNTDGIEGEANSSNTIFEQFKVSEEVGTITADATDAQTAGVGIARFNTDNSLTGSQSLEMKCLWAGHGDLINKPSYPKHAYSLSNTADSFQHGPENRQEVMLCKKNIPYPIPLPRMPDADATTLGLYDRTEHAATIEMDINIQQLAPAYKMTNGTTNSGLAEIRQLTTSGITDSGASLSGGDWDFYTLGRGLHIIWATKPPEQNEDLYSYIARMSNLRAKLADGRGGAAFGGNDNDKLMGMAWEADWDDIDSSNDHESLFSVRQSKNKNAYFGGVSFINTGTNGVQVVPFNGTDGHNSGALAGRGSQGLYLGDHDMPTNTKATQQVYMPIGLSSPSISGMVGIEKSIPLIGDWHKLTFAFDPNASEGFHGAYGTDENLLNESDGGLMQRGHRSLCRMYISTSSNGELLELGAHTSGEVKRYLDIALMGDLGDFESYADGIYAGAGTKKGSVDNWPQHMSIWLTNMKNEKTGNYDLLPSAATDDMVSSVLIDNIKFNNFNLNMANGTQFKSKALTSPISFVNADALASPNEPDQLSDTDVLNTRRKKTPGVVTLGLSTQDYITDMTTAGSNGYEQTWSEWPYGFFFSDFYANDLSNIGSIPDENIKVSVSSAYYSTGASTKSTIPLGHQLTEKAMNHHSNRISTNRHPNYKVIAGDFSDSEFVIQSGTTDSEMPSNEYLRVWSAANTDINGNFTDGEILFASALQDTVGGRYSGGNAAAAIRVAKASGHDADGFQSCSGVASVGSDLFTDAAHGMSNGDRVVFAKSNQDSTMGAGAGLVQPKPGVLYYVVNKGTNTFQVSESSGGTVVTVETNNGNDIASGVKYQKVHTFNTDSGSGSGDDSGLYLISEPNENTPYPYYSASLSWLETGYTVASNDISEKQFTLADNSTNLAGSPYAIRVGDKVRFTSPTCKGDNGGAGYTVETITGALNAIVFTVEETIVEYSGWNKDDANAGEGASSGMSGGVALADNDYAGLSVQIQTKALCDNFSQKGGFQLWKSHKSYNWENSLDVGTHKDFGAVKRENIAASARITEIVSQVGSKATFEVDSIAPFNNDNNDTRYIAYLFGETPTFTTKTVNSTAQPEKIASNSANCAVDLQCETFDPQNRRVTLVWDGNDGAGTEILNYDNLPRLMVSPYKYWVNILHNLTDADGKALTQRHYQNVRLMNNNFTDQDGAKRSWVGEGLSTDITNNFVDTGYDNRSGLGTTFNEILFNDDTFGLVPGAYTNAWDLNLTKEGSFLDCATDHGFGAYDDTKEAELAGGFTGFSYVEDGKYNTIEMPKIVESASLEPEDKLNFLVDFTKQDSLHGFNIDTKDSTNNPPYFMAIYEDEKPQPPILTVEPYKEDPFFAEYKWQTSDDDLWYGILIVDSEAVHSQYHKGVFHLPMNEEGSHGKLLSTDNSSDTAVLSSTGPFNLLYAESADGLATDVTGLSENGIKYDLAGMAGNCYRFDGNNSYIKYDDTGSGNNMQDLTSEASWVFHVTPDNSTMNGATNYIYHSDHLRLSLNGNTGVLTADIYSSSSVYVRLTTNPIVMDGDTPSSIIVTFDANLKAQNCKIFINGKLEDTSGLRMASSTNITNWPAASNIGSVLYLSNNPVYIGSSGNNADGMAGLIEEVVVYKKCIYPVVPSDETFVLTKPLREISNGSAQTYTAKLFMKDYHNVRGSSTTEVATSASVSFRKASFRLEGD